MDYLLFNDVGGDDSEIIADTVDARGIILTTYVPTSYVFVRGFSGNRYDLDFTALEKNSCLEFEYPCVIAEPENAYNDTYSHDNSSFNDDVSSDGESDGS